MALDAAPLLTKKQELAFALETTTGTAAALTAANSVTPVYRPSMRYTTEAVPREASGNLSPVAQGRGARPASCEFETPVLGSGTISTDPDWAKLLRMCGMTVASQVYTPVTGATETGTIGLYQMGRLKKLVGAMGSFVMTIRRGEEARIRWSFQGAQDPPSTTSIIVPTKTTIVPPRAAVTFTIGGTNYCAPEVVFDMGNVVILRECMTAVDSASGLTGYRAGYITDWQPRVRVSPESLSLATRDWYDAFKSSTTFALSIVIGGTAQNIVTLACPKMELESDPTDGDRSGVLVDDLVFIPLRNSDAGNDAVTITFS